MPLVVLEVVLEVVKLLVLVLVVLVVLVVVLVVEVLVVPRVTAACCRLRGAPQRCACCSGPEKVWRRLHARQRLVELRRLCQVCCCAPRQHAHPPTSTPSPQGQRGQAPRRGH